MSEERPEAEQAVLKRFVFLDNASRPYRVHLWGGRPWLFYWHEGQKGWVSLRPVTNSEVEEKMRPRALPEEQAALYDAPWEKRPT